MGQLRYFIEGGKSCRISSDGPDGKTKTKWDIGIQLVIIEKDFEKKGNGMMPFTQISPGWIEARQNLASQPRVPSKARWISYDRTYFAGGGLTLFEGASTIGFLPF